MKKETNQLNNQYNLFGGHMKKRKTHKDEEIFNIKDHIYKIVPKANDISIRVSKSDNGKFESLIKVHIPPKKRLVAVKKDNCLKGSLEKSEQAIIKQIKKVKEKKKPKSARLKECEADIFVSV